jgi:hypothetical protein
MPSKRLRSKRTIAAAVTNLSSSVTRVEQVSVPYQISPLALSGDAFDQDAIKTDAIASGAISSKTLGLSAYVPNGEGTQRVPAPLNDIEYWEDVVEGLIELHRSGIHDNEDIQNVTVTTEGLVFTPTGYDADTDTYGDARIYLTGRLPMPRSGVIYATWKSTATIPIKLIWWTATTPVKVSKASIASSVVTFTTASAHGFSVGQEVKVTGCGSTFNGIYTVVSNAGAEGETTVFTAAANSVAPADVNETVFAIEGLVALEEHEYVNLENKISWRAPDTAGEYAVYAELPYDSTERTLTDAKVFETIGSGKSIVVASNVNNYSITSNVITYTTATDHEFTADDIISVGYSPEEVSAASSAQVSAGSPNVLTVRFSSAHKFHVGYEVLLDLSATPLNGTYTVSAIPNTTAINLLTTINTTANTAVTGNVTATTSPLSGQGKITSTTANTFTVARTNLQDVSSTSISNTLAQVGRPRYSYITYAATNTSANTIEIYTESPHGFEVAEPIAISGLPSETFPGVDGQYTIAAATDRFFRIDNANVSTTVSSTAITAKQALAFTGSSDFNVELSPEGFKFTGSGDASVGSDLRTTADNFLTLSRIDGQVLATIDNQGVGTFSEVAINDAQISGYGLVGTILSDTYNDNAYGVVEYSGDILNRFARGNVYKGYFYIPNNTAITTKYATLAYGRFTLSENRSYLITAAFGGLRGTASTNAVVELLMSTEPFQADAVGPRRMASTLATSVYSEFTPLIGTFYTEAASPAEASVSISSISRSTTTVTVVTSTAHGLLANDYVGVSGTTNTLLEGTFLVATVVNTVAFTYSTETTGTITSLTTGTVRKVSSLLSSAGVLPAGLPIYWLLRLRHAAAPTSYSLGYTSLPLTEPQMELTVIDIGDSRSGLGVDASKVNSSTGLLELSPDSGSGGGTSTYTATETVAASSSAYYDNYGKGSGTSDPYAYKYSLYQGNPGTASGTKKSAVVFPAFAGPPAGATNVTVTKVEVYLRNRHSYNSSGLTTKIGVHNSSSLGSSVPAGVSGITSTSTTFSKGQGKWVTLSSTTHAGFAPDGSQSHRGILISLTSPTGTYDSTLSNYGYFDGNTMSDEPQLRITYTYDL